MGRASKYPPELRERAARMVAESERPIRRVAADLGIHTRRFAWVRRAEADAVPAASRVYAQRRRAGAQRNRRKRNTELERSNQILRETRLLFATELDQTRRR